LTTQVLGNTPADNTEPNHANVLTKGSRHLNAVKVTLQPAFKLAIAQFQLPTFDREQAGAFGKLAVKFMDRLGSLLCRNRRCNFGQRLTE